MRTLPIIDARYWMTLCVASVLGGNTGDFVADGLGLGSVDGLPWLAGVLAAIFIADRWLNLATPVLFWAAILVIRTAATNLGDIFHAAGIGFGVSIPVMAMVMVVAVSLYASKGKGEVGRVRVDWSYWVTMLAAGALGTVLGDGASFGLGLGTLGSTALYFAPFLGMMALSLRTPLTSIGLYWTTIVLIRSAGTAFGDFLAHNVFGLSASTAIVGAVFVAIVTVFYGFSRSGVYVRGSAVEPEATV